MMKDTVLIYVPLPGYLAQWFAHSMGGGVPVRLLRGCMESKILELYLTLQPEGLPPCLGGEGYVPIVVPWFKNKPPHIYCYMPPRAMKALTEMIYNRFDVDLWTSLHDFGKIGMSQKELVFAWLESRGIETTDTNWSAVVKRYQRQRRVYTERERQRLRYKKKC